MSRFTALEGRRWVVQPSPFGRDFSTDVRTRTDFCAAAAFYRHGQGL